MCVKCVLFLLCHRIEIVLRSFEINKRQIWIYFFFCLFLVCSHAMTLSLSLYLSITGYSFLRWLYARFSHHWWSWNSIAKINLIHHTHSFRLVWVCNSSFPVINMRIRVCVHVCVCVCVCMMYDLRTTIATFSLNIFLFKCMHKIMCSFSNVVNFDMTEKMDAMPAHKCISQEDAILRHSANV